MKFFKYNFFKTFITPILLLCLLAISNSCGIYKPVSAREIPPEVDKRVKKNIEEGRGIGGMGGILGKGDGSFQFATSNEMWRASLEILDFIPLANADYAGGIIITDWYTEENTNNEALKITIRFLTILDKTFEIALFEFLLLNTFSIAPLKTLPNIKNITNITIDDMILGVY